MTLAPHSRPRKRYRARVRLSAGALTAIAGMAARGSCPTRRFFEDPPGVGLWGMADWQRAIANDPSPRIFLRKGNKVGGSCLLSWTVKAFLDGIHPSPAWQRPDRPAVVLYIAANLDSSYKLDVAPRLREFIRDSDLSERCRFDSVRGFMVGGGRGIELANGDKVVFGSGTQDALAMAGLSADAVVLNEPPRKHIFAEAMRAAAEHRAPVLMNFTPLPPEALVGNDNLRWLRDGIEDPDNGWSQHVVQLSPESCPHRTPESIERQIRDIYPWERAQRVFAEWDGPAPDRMLDGFSQAVVRECDYEGEVAVKIGLDHGERPGAEVCLVVYCWTAGGEQFMHVLAEYVSAGRTTEQQDALRIQGVLEGVGLSLLNVDEGVGDVNSAGKARAGTSVNEAFETAFAALSGIGRAPFRIKKPYKAKGAQLKAIRLANAAMLDGRLTIHPRCKVLIESVSKWRGRDDDHKHAIDALLYLSSNIDPATLRMVSNAHIAVT